MDPRIFNLNLKRASIARFFVARSFKSIVKLIFLISVAAVSVSNANAAPIQTNTHAGGVHCDIEFGKLGRNAKLTPKSDLIAEFLHRHFTSKRQNAKWIKIANTTEADAGVLFGDIEFSVLQKVNTLTNDKNFATSMAHKHKELTFKAIREIQQRFKGQADLLLYSDFKSARFAIVPKKPYTAAPPEMNEALREAFANVNEEFTQFIRKNKFDVDGEAHNWFRGGIGKTADEANVAARTSRDMGGANVLRDFDDGEIQSNLTTYRKWAESMRQNDIKPDPKMRNLISGDFVKDDVLDIVKKNPDLKRARQRINARYHVELTDAQLERLQIYNEIVDKFSPGIHVAERKIVSVENAEMGGMTADFSGLGAKNRGATARAIAAGDDLRDILTLARRAEKMVTKEFEAAQRAFKKATDPYVARSDFSGDDFGAPVAVPWTRKRIQAVVTAAANVKSKFPKRLAFFHEGVTLGQRNVLSAHGEAIEKLLREELDGKVPFEKLQQVEFGMDMGGKEINQGSVSVIIGESQLVKLSRRDRSEIKKAHERALIKFNAKVGGDYVPGR